MLQNKFLNNKYSGNLFITSFFIVFFFIGYKIHTDYGFYIDEKFHRANGFYWLNYVASFFGLESLEQISKTKLDSIDGFTLPNIKEWNMYGVIFDIPAALLEISLDLNEPIKYYGLRHLMVFIFFFSGSIFFYKILKNRFKDNFVSFLGLFLFILTPRIFGDSFWNNKDIIFLSLYTISLFYFFKLIDNESWKNILLLSLFSAFATSIRIAGIFIPLSLLFFFLLNKLSERNDVTLRTIILYLVSYIIFLFISWPFLWSNFSSGFLSIFQLSMSWSGKVNFLGEYYLSNNLPYYYLIFWIIISTPIIHLTLFIYGFLSCLQRIIFRYFNIKKNNIYNDLWRSNLEKKDFLVFINLVFFLCALSFLNLNLYNSWRLGYFLNTFIIYFSTFGVYLLIIKFKNRVNLIKILSFFLILFSINRIFLYHPYQSLYFNILTPTFIKNNVDVDYTGLSGLSFLKKLAATEEVDFPIKVSVNSWYPLWRMTELLDEEEREKILVFGNDKKKDAEYLYSNRIYDVDKKYHKKYDIPANFKKIEVFEIDNTIIYEVYKKEKK